MPNAQAQTRKRIEKALSRKLPNAYIFVTGIMKNTSPDIVLKEAQQAITPLRRSTKKAMVHLLIARAMFLQTRYDECRKEVTNILENEKLPDSLRAFAYNMIANTFIRQNNIKQAEKFSKSALSLTRKQEDEIFVDVLNTVGMIHSRQERHSLAVEYYDTCSRVALRIGAKIQAITTMSNCALTLGYLGRDDEALERLLKARELCVLFGDHRRLAFVHKILGGHYGFVEDLDKCIEHFNTSLKLYEEVGEKNQHVECHTEISRAYYGLEKYDEAVKYANKALGYADELDQKVYLPGIYRLLGLIHAELNDSKAEGYYKASIKHSNILDPGGDSWLLGRTFLDYGKFLVTRDGEKSAGYLRKAIKIMEKKAVLDWERQSIKEAKELLLKVDKESQVLLETEVDEKPEQNVENFKKILEITKAINSETEMENVLELVLDAALQISGAERGLIVLAENGRWEFTFPRNFVGSIADEPDYELIISIIERVLAEGKQITGSDSEHFDSYIKTNSQASKDVEAVFAFPLVIREEIIGCVYLDSRFVAMELPVEQQDMLKTVIEQAALIIGRTRLYEQVRKLSQQLGKEVDRQHTELENVRTELEHKQQELEERYSFENIVGNSKKMKDIFEIIKRVAESDLPVCIYGESGTGKELVAKAIHYNGHRRNNHFVAINCAAIPENLLESELFGYEKGAFTGADETKPGLLEYANGGTLMLDEIGNMSSSMQQKLLRVVQEKEIRRVGATSDITIDVRIISVSNTDLGELVKSHRFREDLYYRLNVLSLTLPSLRNRKEDIPFLAEHFWKQAAGSSLDISHNEKADFLLVLLNYDWPGNVRELENEIHRLVSLGAGSFNMRNLSPHVLTGAGKVATSEGIFLTGETVPLSEIERRCILSALHKARGNRSEAARILGIPRTSIDSKMRKLKIQLEEVRYN